MTVDEEDGVVCNIKCCYTLGAVDRGAAEKKFHGDGMGGTM
jgi:hypothetical protein